MTDIVIKKLRFPENIRTNLGMYLGTNANFTTPNREIINNSTDELMNKHGDTIYLYNTPTYKVVVDNGRGLPVYIDPDYGDRVITESILTDTHSGSKFDSTDEKNGGLHGVGSTAVNAVCARYIVAVNLLKKPMDTTLPWIAEAAGNCAEPFYVLEYEGGIKKDEKVVDTIAGVYDHIGCDVGLPDDAEISTFVFFVPDLTIYESAKASISIMPLKMALLESAENARIFVNNEPIPAYDFLTDVAEIDVDPLNEIINKQQFQVRHSLRTEDADIATDEIMIDFAWRKSVFTESIESMINLIETTDGGLVNKVVRDSVGYALSKYSGVLTPSDARYGLIAMGSMFSTRKKKFSSQTKEKLLSLDKFNHNKFVTEVGEKILNDVILKNEVYFQALCNRLVEYKTQMNRISSTDFIKTRISYGDDSERSSARRAVAAKVYEALSGKASERELYITEGLSASGGIIKYRDKRTQSVLPLRGKLVNTSTFELEDVVGHSEALAVINTVGVGAGSLVRLEKCRYNKIIIATDLDSDGGHIANMIVGLIWMHIPELIRAGKVYKLDAPYYRVNGDKHFFYDEKDKIDFESAKVDKLKGLGSYEVNEVKKFIVGKERRLIQITAEDTLGIESSIKLLYSSLARKRLMIDRGILSDDR